MYCSDFNHYTLHVLLFTGTFSALAWTRNFISFTITETAVLITALLVGLLYLMPIPVIRHLPPMCDFKFFIFDEHYFIENISTAMSNG